MAWALRSDDIIQPLQFAIQYLLIKKQDGGKRLILCRGGYIPVYCKIGEKG